MVAPPHHQYVCPNPLCISPNMPNDVIKLRILRGGVYPGLSREALNAITRILIREGGRGSLGTDTQRRDTHR